jgi:hypothetical protein
MWMFVCLLLKLTTVDWMYRRIKAVKHRNAANRSTSHLFTPAKIPGDLLGGQLLHCALRELISSRAWGTGWSWSCWALGAGAGAGARPPKKPDGPPCPAHLLLLKSQTHPPAIRLLFCRVFGRFSAPQKAFCRFFLDFWAFLGEGSSKFKSTIEKYPISNIEKIT